MKIRNWGRNFYFEPKEILKPKTPDDFKVIIKEAVQDHKKIRVAGSRHSFSELIATSDILIDTGRLTGLVDINRENRTATFMAGTKISEATALLYEHGLAFPNQGDIDKQTLAGAFSTGTHGTGLNYSSLARMIKKVEFIDGMGELRSITSDNNQDLLEACRINFGAFGIATKFTLECVDAFILECRSYNLPLSDVLARAENYWSNNQHFEFFWFPYSDLAQVKISNPVSTTKRRNPIKKFIADTVLENIAFETACRLACITPKLAPSISKFCGWMNPDNCYAEPAHQVFPTDRRVIFVEMEYTLPLESGIACFNEIKDVIARNRIPVFFPIEFRVAGADKAWVSPMYGRDNAIISLHVYRGFHQHDFFSQCEPIFKKYGGRPHWGKVHNLDAKELPKLYPKWSEFCALREEFDPHRVFMNKKIESYFENS